MIEDLHDIISELSQIKDFITASHRTIMYKEPCSLLIATAGNRLSALRMDIYRMQDKTRESFTDETNNE